MSAAAEPIPPIAPPAGRAPARTWTVFTAVLTWAVFLQAVTAGRVLTGDEWARDVHRIAAGLLLIVAVVGGLVALVRLRDRAGGRRFGWLLVAMGVGLLVQHSLGTAAADGDDTLWIHVPLGVALLALMVRVDMVARRVGGRT
jgi:hypothetical protein